jgi:hypothetical protein
MDSIASDRHDRDARANIELSDGLRADAGRETSFGMPAKDKSMSDWLQQGVDGPSLPPIDIFPQKELYTESQL